MLNLRRCNKPHQLHFEMLSVFIDASLEDKDIKAIRDCFSWMDEDSTGTVEIEELRKAFVYLNERVFEGKSDKGSR